MSLILIAGIALALIILVCFAQIGFAREKPGFPSKWHGISAIALGFAFTFLGLSGGPGGFTHRESDLDIVSFWFLFGFGVMVLGVILLVWAAIRSRRAAYKK